MNRRQFIENLGVGAAAAGLLGCQGRSPRKADGAPGYARPNFLVLISDDQRWDQLSSADQPIIPELRTPNLDGLAQKGVSFRNAFVTSPVCCVSRASIMSGRYASTHGMNHFNTPMAPEVLSRTYPALLHDNGYRTGILGKWGMGIEGTEKVFDVFNAWEGQGQYFHHTDKGKIHNAEWLADRSREFLEACPRERPFCLTVCYKSPHHPYQPDERDKRLFEDVDIPRRKTDTRQAYQAVKSDLMERSLNRWCYFDERGDERSKDDFEKNFLRCVISLDRSVGRVVQTLRDLDLDGNTVIIFLSDNGYLWGEHGLGGKWLLYEESIRVPLILYGPGIAENGKGTKADDLALNIDIAPTILDIAGIPIPAEMDGSSLGPVLQGKKGTGRQDFFMEHVDVVDVENPIPDSRGVRSKEWKYIRYVNAGPEVEEMYHVSVDPMETENLADDGNFIEIKSDLVSKYESYLRSFPANERNKT